MLLIPPIEGSLPHHITSDYAERYNPVTGEWEFHKAIDLAFACGTPILVVAPGTVSNIRYPYPGQDTAPQSNNVTIDHGNGYHTYYTHMQYIYVNVGDEIPQGHILGTVGSTGQSTGCHLHFEISHNGENFDPKPYLWEGQELPIDGIPIKPRKDLKIYLWGRRNIY